MMSDFRKNPPKSIANSKVTVIKDYKTGNSLDIETGSQSNLDFPKSNVLQFFTESGAKITVRPSGTEPKIKFYIGLKAKLNSKSEYDNIKSKLELQISEIKRDLGL